MPRCEYAGDHVFRSAGADLHVDGREAWRATLGHHQRIAKQGGHHEPGQRRRCPRHLATALHNPEPQRRTRLSTQGAKRCTWLRGEEGRRGAGAGGETGQGRPRHICFQRFRGAKQRGPLFCETARRSANRQGGQSISMLSELNSAADGRSRKLTFPANLTRRQDSWARIMCCTRGMQTLGHADRVLARPELWKHAHHNSPLLKINALPSACLQRVCSFGQIRVAVPRTSRSLGSARVDLRADRASRFFSEH